MFSNDAQNRLKTPAIPTLFDIPNPPAKVGSKRRLVEKVSAIESHGTGNYVEFNFVHSHAMV